jgi:hypothetical protein
VDVDSFIYLFIFLNSGIYTVDADSFHLFIFLIFYIRLLATTIVKADSFIFIFYFVYAISIHYDSFHLFFYLIYKIIRSRRR